MVLKNGEGGDFDGVSSLFSSAKYFRDLGIKEIWVDSIPDRQGEFLQSLARKFPLLQRTDERGNELDFFDFETPGASIKRNIGSSTSTRLFLQDLRQIADRISHQLSLLRKL
jgi:hypothetical protein